METNVKVIQPKGRFRPSLAMFHPTGRGTGAAMKMALHPAHDDVAGSIMMTLAAQKAIGDRTAPIPTFARFDWENAVCVKLGFNDLCKILQVFRGECESIDEGRGLCHRTVRATTRIALRHILEPVPGHSLEVHRLTPDGKETRIHLHFNPAESLGLMESIAGSLSVVSFGIPMLVDRPVGAAGMEPQESVRVSA